MSSCQGACCAVFPLSTPYDRLRDRWPYFTDGDQILDMVEPIDLVSALERCIDLGIETFHARPGRPLYTCRHWDTETRLCGIYEQRPAMCRDYPYGHPCDHGCDCTDNYPPDVQRPSPCPSPTGPAPATC